MSFTYVFNFDFDLDPLAPDWVLELFQVLARGEIPSDDILGHLDQETGGAMSAPNDLMGWPIVGSRVMVWQTGMTNEGIQTDMEPRATHHVNFVTKTTDDAYVNGGYIVPFVFFDYVASSGLYCVQWIDLWRNDVSHYYKDGEDVLLVDLKTKDFPSPLSPHDQQDPNRNLYGWKPTQQNDFKVIFHDRITPEMRAELWPY